MKKVVLLRAKLHLYLQRRLTVEKSEQPDDEDCLLRSCRSRFESKGKTYRVPSIYRNESQCHHTHRHRDRLK